MSFLDRLIAQKQAAAGISEPIVASPMVLESPSAEKPCPDAKTAQDDPVSSEEMGFYLTKLEEKTAPAIDPNSIAFDCIQNFVGWYEQHRAAFNDKQRIALETLVAGRMQINLGCSCRQQARQKMADDYFKNFFLMNQKTDIIPAIKLAAGASLLIFKLGAEEFLRT